MKHEDKWEDMMGKQGVMWDRFDIYGFCKLNDSINIFYN